MDRLYRRMPLFVLLIGVAVLFHRLLLGEVLFWGTPLLQFYPWREMAWGMLRGGCLPLWNPLVGNGAPLLANYQTAIFYPPNWLYWVIPTEHAMGWVGLLHLVWAGLGTIAYLRRLGVGQLGQGIGALSFALSGYLVARFGFLSITSVVAWLPWLLWGIDGVFMAGGGRDSRRAFALSAGIVAMLLLAGHAQTGFYSLVLAGLYALWRGGIVKRLPKLGWILGALGLGAALAAIQLVPTFELMQASQRASGLEPEFALTYSFWPWRFLTFLAPNLFGSPTTGDYWGYGAYWEDAVYVGLLTLVMAGHGLGRWVREWRAKELSMEGRVVPFFALILPLVFVLALGSHTAIFPWLFNHVPTFNLFQAPARWMILAAFALGVLAAVGADGWQSSPQRLFWTRLLTAGGLSVCVVSLLAERVSGQPLESTFIHAFTRLGVMVVLVGLLSLLLPQAEKRPRLRPWWELLALILLTGDLVTAHWGLNPTIDPVYYHQGSALADALAAHIGDSTFSYRTLYLPDDEQDAKFHIFLEMSDFQPGERAHWDSLRDSLIPNLGMLDGVPSANNFDPLRVGYRHTLFENLDKAAPDEAVEMTRNMNVGVLLSPRYRADLELIDQSGLIYAYQVPDPWPRAALADCAPIEGILQCERLSLGVVSIERDEVTRLYLRVESGEAATLVLTDTYYPGWQATLDGETVPIRRVSGAFRGVDVPAGEHEVIFAYRPMSIGIGAAISGLSWLALAAWWLLERSKGSL